MRSIKLSCVIPWWILLCGWVIQSHTTQASPSSTLHPPIHHDLEILTYHIQSVVISRYAVTTITCRIKNPTLDPQEAAFSILLPATAFISNLTIEAGGRNYTSLVKEKEEARRTYEKAKSKGQNTAIVHQKERETSRFRVDVTVSAQEEVIFYLTYEELLERRLGSYTHRLNVHPGYPVRDLLVDITIHETRNISVLNVTNIPGGQDFGNAVSEWREGSKTARLQFDPDPSAMPEDGVIHGQLTVKYDVDRDLDAGDVQVEDGYFVHFFAPSDIQYTPKHISFLIDVSGSMGGTKLKQVKEAFRHILSNLNDGDTFNIVTFASSVHVFGTLRFSGITARRAKKYIKNLEANGGTNIDQGLKDTLEQVVEPDITDSIRPHIVVLLTDGEPTAGVTNHADILKNVRNRNRDSASIFCLGFGTGADMDFLTKVALQNHGTARKIYEESDAAEQLKGFYQELSSPILLDVEFSYSDDAVDMNSLSNTNFYSYFEGKELIVTGQTNPEQENVVRANITGKGRNGEFFMGVTPFNTVAPPDHHLLQHLHLAPTPPNFIKRLWAFLKVKDLLEAEKAARGSHEKAVAQKEALAIALENHFVTPLTSLVVVQPDQENCKDYEDDEIEECDEEVDPGVAPTKGPMQGDGRNQSLNTQNSVSNAFNPASIQLRTGDAARDEEFRFHDMNKNLVYGLSFSGSPTVSVTWMSVLLMLLLTMQNV